MINKCYCDVGNKFKFESSITNVCFAPLGKPNRSWSLVTFNSHTLTPNKLIGTASGVTMCTLDRVMFCVQSPPTTSCRVALPDATRLTSRSSMDDGPGVQSANDVIDAPALNDDDWTSTTVLPDTRAEKNDYSTHR